MVSVTNLSQSKALNFNTGQRQQMTGYTAPNRSLNKPVDKKEGFVFFIEKKEQMSDIY